MRLCKLHPQFFVFMVVTALASLSQAQSYCVRLADAKLFAKASEHSKMLAQPPIYTPLLGTGNHKGTHGAAWIEVTDSDSQKFWIQRKYLSSKLNCLVVNSERTSLRTGPGKDYSQAHGKASYAQRKQAFIDLGGEDGWTQVQDKNGSTYWMDMDDTWKAQRSMMRISFDNK